MSLFFFSLPGTIQTIGDTGEYRTEIPAKRIYTRFQYSNTNIKKAMPPIRHVRDAIVHKSHKRKRARDSQAVRNGYRLAHIHRVDALLAAKARYKLTCYKKGCESSPNCSFCLEPIGKKTFVCLPCGHVYHKVCTIEAIRHQIARDFRCPLCRATYTIDGVLALGVHDCSKLGANIGNMHVDHILLAAANNGLKELVRRALDEGANLSYTDETGNTPLHLAATNGYIDIVRLLLIHGAQVDKQNSVGETPLHRASHPDIVSLIVERALIQGTNDHPFSI